jgi:hypothetical protein
MAQKVNINGISSSVLQNINLYPGLKGFLNQSDLQLMQQEMGGLISAGIGGQRRRLGRTLMANNICDKNNTSNFEQIVRGAVGRLQASSSDQDVTFHICAGLAGGTGSGSIIDAITQIRTWFPYQEETHAFKIRLFLYTPERTLVSARHDAGFYQANGYAALQELNASGRVTCCFIRVGDREVDAVGVCPLADLIHGCACGRSVDVSARRRERSTDLVGCIARYGVAVVAAYLGFGIRRQTGDDLCVGVGRSGDLRDRSAVL